MQPPKPLRPVELLPPLLGVKHSDTVARLIAASMQSDNDTLDDITYLPEHVWTKMPTSADLVAERQERRKQRGWTVDFEDYQSPFQKNISNKLIKFAAEEEEAAAYKLKTGKRK